MKPNELCRICEHSKSHSSEKRNDFLKLLKSHLVNLAEGVATSVLAGYLMN